MSINEERGVRLAGADGVAIVADAFGEKAATPIILIHGGGQSRSAWRGAARRFAEAGYHAICIDLRGHGDSDWAPDGNYAFERYIADMASIVGELGQRAVLVGASLGGHVAMMTASARPDLVLALALADVTPWVDEDFADGIRNAMRSAAEGFDNVDEAALMVARLRGTEPRSDNRGLLAFLDEREDGRLYWRWDPRFIQDHFVRHGGEGGMFARAAAKLQVPTLLMKAEFSTIVTWDQVDYFRKALPSLTCEEIKGVGHMVTGDDNDSYAEAVLRYLDRLGYTCRPGGSTSEDTRHLGSVQGPT